MRLLADENCDFAVVRALRLAGVDVVAVDEVLPGAEDSRVSDLAVAETRMVITEDYLSLVDSYCVILVVH